MGGEDGNTEIGIEHRAKLESRLRALEEGGARRISGTGKAQAKWEKYENKSEVKTYDPAADSTLPNIPKKRKNEDDEDSEEFKPKKIKVEVKEEPSSDGEDEAPKKKKKDKKRESEGAAALDSTMDTSMEPATPSSEK